MVSQQKVNFISFLLVLVLSIGFVAGVTTISDLKVDSPLGVYLAVQTLVIDVPGTPLVFTDSTNSTAYAVFNAPTNFTFAQIEGITGNLAFPNGTTTFLGDVSNFDDIDGQSRFKETNVNNGTSASAAFVAENDAGFKTAFGIGGSNFEFSGENLNNFGTIFHQGPGGFNFVNSFLTGWKWRVNADNTTSSFDFVDIMNLSVDGTLSVVDVVSQGLFDRIDNVTEIDSDVVFNLTLPVLYAADTTSNEVTINITFGTIASFQVWDAKKKFNSNSAIINILNADDVTIDHIVELNKKDKAFQFYFDGTFWNYAEIGKGQFSQIASSHNAIADFGDLVLQNDANTILTVNGSLNLLPLANTYVGGQAFICVLDSGILVSSESAC